MQLQEMSGELWSQRPIG